MSPVLVNPYRYAVTGGPSGDFLCKYDASLGVTGTTDVTAWANQGTGGSSYDLDTSTGTPALVTGVINGLPVIRYDGSSGLGTGGNSTSGPWSAIQTVTAYVVGTRGGDGLEAGRYIISLWDAVHSAFNVGAKYDTNNKPGGQFDTAGWVVCNETYPAVDTFFILVVVRESGGTVTFRMNGSALTPTFSSTEASSQKYAVGVGATGTADSSQWKGDVAEAGITNTALSSGDIASLFTELNTKYSVY